MGATKKPSQSVLANALQGLPRKSKEDEEALVCPKDPGNSINRIPPALKAKDSRANLFRKNIEDIEIYLRDAKHVRGNANAEHLEHTLSILTRYMHMSVKSLRKIDWVIFKQLVASVKMLQDMVYPQGPQTAEAGQSMRELFGSIGPGMVNMVSGDVHVHGIGSESAKPPLHGNTQASLPSAMDVGNSHEGEVRSGRPLDVSTQNHPATFGDLEGVGGMFCGSPRTQDPQNIPAPNNLAPSVETPRPLPQKGPPCLTRTPASKNSPDPDNPAGTYHDPLIKHKYHPNSPESKVAGRNDWRKRAQLLEEAKKRIEQKKVLEAAKGEDLEG